MIISAYFLIQWAEFEFSYKNYKRAGSDEFDSSLNHVSSLDHFEFRLF